MAKTQDRPKPRMTTASVHVPLVAVPPASIHVQRHVEVVLSAGHAQALYRLTGGLDETASRLRSGRVVQKPADALRWLIEQVVPQGGNDERT